MQKILLLSILLIFKIKTQLPDLGGLGGGKEEGGGEGDGSKGITIAPPPMPQEILPPKPIIIAPLLVKQHRNRKRVSIYKAGPTLPPLGFDQGPIYPAMNDFNGFPDYRGSGRKLGKRMLKQRRDFQRDLYNRNLAQQIIMENTANEDPEYTKKLSTAGGTSHWSLSPKFERLKDNVLADEKDKAYSVTKERFNELDEKLNELDNEIIDMQTEEKQGIGHIESEFSKYRDLVGKAKSFGYKFKKFI